MFRQIKLLFAVLLCRLATAVSRLLGHGGSSMPGKIVLWLMPDVLTLIELPEKVVAVTGSNGKTSTVELIAQAIRETGHTVVWNKEGSNQTEGIVTFLLNSCSFAGKVQAEYVVMEADERYAQHTFRCFHPTHYVITNLCRDQLTRNGHPESVYEAIENSIDPKTQLILNADDPLVRRFGFLRKEENVIYYGAQHLSSDVSVLKTAYQDGTFCPVCKKRMTYDYFHYNHLGNYHCSCGYSRPQTTYSLTEADLTSGIISINDIYSIRLPYPSQYAAYNLLAAFAAVVQSGVSASAAAIALNGYESKTDRIIPYMLPNNHGTALISKHENSVSYDQSIEFIANDQRSCQVLIIVDAVSRKYYTSDTSWLWDIDYEKLNLPQVHRVLLSGIHCHDLAVRLRFAGFSGERAVIEPSISDAVSEMDHYSTETTYVITCFSDIQKFQTLKNVSTVREMAA